MDTKGRPPVVPLLLFLFLFQILAPGLAFDAAAQSSGHDAKGVVMSAVLLYARGGGLETEYVNIHNPGNSEKDLKGWKLCDDHQCAIFPNVPTILVAGSTMTVAQNATAFSTMWSVGAPAFAYLGALPPTRPFANGSIWPAMLNDGDYLWLEDDQGTIVDAAAFGRDYQGAGWTGGPGPAPKMGWTMVREYRLDGTKRVYQDTNSSADWPIYRTRRAELQPSVPFEESWPSQLTALRFPEDGAVLANILKGASSEIVLNTYEFTSFSMGKIISDRAKAGVKVQVILEGHPVGGIQPSETNVIRMLTESGCEVRLIWSNSSTDRYYPFGLDHAKYMVLDKGTSIVISENFVPSALGTVNSTANRGWGIALKEDVTALYLKNLFNKDWATSVDASKVLLKGAANWKQPSGERPFLPVGPAAGTTFEGPANITVLVSPDTTEDLLLNIINHTNNRLYIEQLTFDMDWHLHSGITQTQKSPLLLAIIGAARRGVDVKVLVDSTYLDSNDNEAVVKYINEVGNAEGLKFQARLASIPNITTVHNKGVVADDTVLVSSINWGSSAVRDNREIGLAVRMEGLDTLYVSYFMKDWDPKAPLPDDGPAPTTGGQVTSTYLVCGGLLAFVACGLVIIVLTRRGRI
jgi:cardiolipin synthase A/B